MPRDPIAEQDRNFGARFRHQGRHACAGRQGLLRHQCARPPALLEPVSYFPKRSYETSGEVATRNQKLRLSTLGLGLRQQSALFDGRLLAYATARFDYVRYRHRDFLTAATSFTPFVPGYTIGQVIKRKDTELKPNIGVNYKITPAFRAFANYSESWCVTQGNGALIVANPTYKSEAAKGYDYGFKGSLLADRLNYTLSGFYATRANVSAIDFVESPVGSGNFVQQTLRNGDQLVRGFEADVSWTVTKEFLPQRQLRSGGFHLYGFRHGRPGGDRS